MSRETNRLNSNGSVLTQVLVVLGVVGVFSGIILESVNRLYLVDSSKVFHPASINLIADQVTSLLEQDGVWQATIAKNPSLACIATNGTSCPVGDQPIDIYLPDGSLYLSQSSTDGFDKSGYRCTTFNSTSGDRYCVYKARVSWSAVCPSPPCVSSMISASSPFATSPQQRVKLQVFYRSLGSGLSTEVEVMKGGLEFDRGGRSNSIKAFCSAIPGKMVGGGIHCRVNIQPTNCRADGSKNSVGFVRPDGSVQCATPGLFGNALGYLRCNPGNAIWGMEGDYILCNVF